MSSRTWYANVKDDDERHRLAEFAAAYEERTKGFQIHAPVDPGVEGDFSWRQCDTCGSKLGGNRTPCVLINPGSNKRIEVESCDDCVMYATYGYLEG